MNYPSIILTESDSSFRFPSQLKRIDYDGFSIAYQYSIESELFKRETDEYFILSHSNIGFRKRLGDYDGDLSHLFSGLGSLLPDFHWGFICLFKKTSKQLVVYNDIFGIYPIYYLEHERGFTLSNDFNLILRNEEKWSFDTLGMYDYFLFNYTLNQRTLIKGISQLWGGGQISYEIAEKKFNVRKVHLVADFIHNTSSKEFKVSQLTAALDQHLQHDLDNSLPIQLPLSGGFDSKVILSILLGNQAKFETYTYGSKGSVDHVAAEATAMQFNLPNKLLRIDCEGIDFFDEQIREFILCTPALPLILDLLAYEVVKREIPASNIILGAMGGELINGPVIISEVIVTRSAEVLNSSKNIQMLKEGMLKDITSISFLSNNHYVRSEDAYLGSIRNYLQEGNERPAKNITNFMINETYAKFFGVVFRSLFGKYNLVNPFLDLEFLRILLNSKYSYLKNKLFSKSPTRHFFSRRLYALMVRKMYKPALYSPLDRNYVLADLLYLHRIPLPFMRYVENHVFGKNKIESAKTLNYIKWLKPLLIDKLRNSPILNLDIIEKGKVFELLKQIEIGAGVSDYQVRKLILLLSLHYLSQEYNIISNE
jgi:hypothetical protein